MKNEKEIISDYWELLNLAEDFITEGYRKDHPVPETAEDSLEKIALEISNCRKCRLCETRTNTVPGKGVAKPVLMIIGEGPGRDEDRTGNPFVGRAGQYMDKWMDAINLSRERDLFIGNIVKCRPPENRDPHPDEIEACIPYLERQIKLLRPSMILTVGRISSQVLTGRQEGIGRLRGQIYEYRGIPLIPTYHPSGVLRNPEEYRKPVWDDLKKVRGYLDELR